MQVDGLSLVAVPAEFRGTLTFTVGVIAGASDPGAADKLIGFLRGPVAGTAIEAAGMRRVS